MNNTIPTWRIEALIKTLHEIVAEDTALIERHHATDDRWHEGRLSGYKRVAKWLEEIVEKSK